MSAPASTPANRPRTLGIAIACLTLAALLGHWWMYQRPLLSPTLPPGISYSGPLMLFGEPQGPDWASDASPASQAGIHITRPIWDDLNKSQQQLLVGLQPIWPYISSAEKRRWLALAEQGQAMDEASRNHLIRNIAAWGVLSEEQRQSARQEFHTRNALEQARLVQAWQDYSALSPQERIALADAAHAAQMAAQRPAKRTTTSSARQRGQKLVRIAASRQAQPGLPNAPKVPLRPVRITAPEDDTNTSTTPRPASAVATVQVPDPAPPPEPTRVRYWHGVPITPAEPAPIYVN